MNVWNSVPWISECKNALEEIHGLIDLNDIKYGVRASENMVEDIIYEALGTTKSSYPRASLYEWGDSVLPHVMT